MHVFRQRQQHWHQALVEPKCRQHHFSITVCQHRQAGEKWVTGQHFTSHSRFRHQTLAFARTDVLLVYGLDVHWLIKPAQLRLLDTTLLTNFLEIQTACVRVKSESECGSLTVTLIKLSACALHVLRSEASAMEHLLPLNMSKLLDSLHSDRARILWTKVKIR